MTNRDRLIADFEDGWENASVRIMRLEKELKTARDTIARFAELVRVVWSTSPNTEARVTAMIDLINFADTVDR